MKLLIAAFVLVSLASGANSDPIVCESIKGPKVVSYSGEERDVFFPCKYWAVKNQICGKYSINIAPGHEWYEEKYEWDTMWLRVLDTDTGDIFYGRTYIKPIVKALTSSGNIRDIFNLKKEEESTLEYGDIFESVVNLTDNTVVARAEGFQITFKPRDHRNAAEYPTSTWKFECYGGVANGYGADESEEKWQVCGDLSSDLTQRAINLGFEGFEQNVLYHDMLKGVGVVQTSKYCRSAVTIYNEVCSNDTERVKVMNQCADILYNTNITRCIGAYTCHPMEAFNACLIWGCKYDFAGTVDVDNTAHNLPDVNDKDLGTGKVDKKGTAHPVSCEDLHEVLYFCPRLSGSGNISDMALSSDCFKKFIPIEFKQSAAERKAEKQAARKAKKAAEKAENAGK